MFKSFFGLLSRHSSHTFQRMRGATCSYLCSFVYAMELSGKRAKYADQTEEERYRILHEVNYILMIARSFQHLA
ncbi:hypothetical protein OE88DRAFT_1729755 [Heliocybe sulcata]|uniref:Uncharacterized protein n=1 Tax=Heliocybe sulcata TaxID=5364 RepID=A0A5C3MIX4_9AGAM|nr:hypothetical protein OE88DRAFT_1729755 [Heliocybe sulcata]